jgi:hypothetical protein
MKASSLHGSGTMRRKRGNGKLEREGANGRIVEAYRCIGVKWIGRVGEGESGRKTLC